MKKMKKFLAMMLALVMVLGMTVTVSAAEPEPTPGTGKKSDKGTITIQGVDEKVEASGIKLYPVLTADYDKVTENFTGYVAVEAAAATLNKYQKAYADKQNEGLAEDAKNRTPETYVEALKAGKDVKPDVNMINELAGLGLTAATGYTVTKSEKTRTETISGKEVTVADYTCTNVPVGMYLVSIPGTETIVYNHAIASIYYVENNGMANDPLIMNAEIAAKATLAPVVEKEAKDEKGNAVSSVNVGDTIKYTVKVNPVPNYSGKNPVLNVVDTLSKNLELQDINTEGNLVVKVGDTTLTKGTHYTAVKADGTEGKTILTIDFVVGEGENKAYTLSEYAGQELVIEYSAKLIDKENNEVAGNQEANGNDVILNYTRDSKIDGDGGKTTSDDQTYTYTFNIGGNVTGVGDTSGFITKVGDKTKEDETKLEGAYFTMYQEGTTAGSREKYTNESDSFVTTESLEGVTLPTGVTAAELVGTLRSDADGHITVRGLKEGTYYLKETTAPDGYTLNSHEFRIIVSATYYTDADASTEHPAGTLKTWSIKIDDKDENTFEVQNDGKNASLVGGKTLDTMTKVEIQNTTMSTLPSTGGIGTTIFTIAGCAIMILAAALFFASRRKNLQK